LGIGTNAPTHPINILSTNAALGFRLEHATPSSASFPFQITNSADTNYIRANVNIIELFRNGGASTIRTKGSNNELLIQSVRHLQLAVNDGTIAAQLYSTGNLVLQNGGTFSDGGQRLQVIGDAFIKGSGATSATTALSIQDSAGVQIFRVRNDNKVFVSNLSFGTDAPDIFPTATGAFDNNGGSLTIRASQTNYGVASYNIYLNHVYSGRVNTSGTSGGILQTLGFSPTSGTGIFNQLRLTGTINQTGGANGISRGVYVDPILTAAADWRSIEWSNNSGWGLYGAGTANNYLAGKLVIGTTTVSTFALDVNGTARVSGDATSKSFVATGATGVSTGQGTYIDHTTDSYGRLFSYNNSTGSFLPILFGSSRLILSATLGTRPEGLVGNSAYFSGDVRMVSASNYFGSTDNNGIYAPATYSNANYPAIENNSIGIIAGVSAVSNPAFIIATKISFQIGSGTSSKIAQFSPTTGNLILQGGGTFTDAGFRLDVNGTARVSGQITAPSLISSSTSLNLGHDGATKYTLTGGEIFRSGSSGWMIAQFLGGPGLGSYGLYIDTTNKRTQIGAASVTSFTLHGVNNNVSLDESGFGPVSTTSALLQVNSVSRGFLPPRMTTTQKNAISSPAAGLQVYDTTLNQMSYYNGTTWVNF
jgi:hypothetical protein